MAKVIDVVKDKVINKVKNKIDKLTLKEKKALEIIIFFLIAYILILGKVITDNIRNYDTMWTFGFAQKIAQGYIPYRDYNMVITPLFAQLTAIFMKIFSSNIFVFLMVGIVEVTLVLLFQYLIFRKMKISIKASIVSVFLTSIYMVYCATNSYNILACMFMYILIFIEIIKIRYDRYIRLTKSEEKVVKIFKKKIKYTFLYNALTGLILGLMFLSKQNIGIYCILAITIYYFLKSLLLKEISFENSFIQLTTKAIFCILPIIIEVIYLYCNGALYNFIDYCFLGIGTFNQKIRASLFKAFFNPNIAYRFIINVVIISFVIIVPVVIILKLKNKIIIKNNIDLNVLILTFLICLVGIAYSIPLANDYHMYMTKYICLTMIIVNIFSFNKIKKYIYSSISTTAFAVCIITPILCGILSVNMYFNKLTITSLQPFEHTYLTVPDELEIKSIAGYVKNFEKVNNIPVYITTSNSTIFNVLNNKNGGVFELPLHGNLGHEDYNKLINELKKLEQENEKFAVLIHSSDDDMFWQDAKELPKYIRENYTKYDEFSNYSTYIYERNN